VWCGGKGMSGEHFWSEWTHDHVDYGGTGRKRGLHTQILDVPVHEPKSSAKKSPLNNLKLRLPCEACNNGWMSTCETAAKPHLIPMITGGSCTLNADAQRAVATWCVMKAMLAECDKPDLAVCPQADRDAMRTTRTIPDYFEVRAGRHGLDSKASYLRRAETLYVGENGKPPVIPADAPIKNVMTATWVIGTLVVAVMAVRSNITPDKMFKVSDTLAPRIWPQDVETLAWPPPVRMTKDHTMWFAHRLDALSRMHAREGKLTWAPHPHDKL
jgi:hypothetical protein